MSSMRNAVQRRNHKERAQPSEREKWGLLEKHKDYSLRAKDYNAKKARLKVLRSKAAERNPDEFHYGMLSSRSKGGRKLADRRNPVLSHDAVKLLKTQDSGYLRAMMQKSLKQIERLQEQFVLKPGVESMEALALEMKTADGKKIIYAADSGSQRAWADLMQPDQTNATIEDMDEDELCPQHSKSGRVQRREKQALQDRNDQERRNEKEQSARKAKLLALRTRVKELEDAETELENQRARLNNAIGGVNKAGVKFKIRERKK